MRAGRSSDVARFAACAAGGWLLYAAFPPMEAPETAWVALIPWLFLARHTPAAAAFKWGFLGGLFFWLPNLSWLLRLAQSGGPVPAVLTGWIFLSAYCALYGGAFVSLASAWMNVLGLGGGAGRARAMPAGAAWLRRLALTATLPAVWVALEYVRSTALGGFPWNALGVSQYRNLAVIQIAEWGGVYAVSALVALLNGGLGVTAFALVDAWRSPRARERFHPELMAALLVCALCWTYGVRRVRELRVREAELDVLHVAAVQPNIPQVRKWSEWFRRDNLERLRVQTEFAVQANPRLDLIVWPETAVPSPVLSDADVGEWLRSMLRWNVPLLVGSMEVTGTAGRERCFNSSFLFAGETAAPQVYRKQHLVPFGEYVPLDKRFPALQRLVPIGVSCWPGGHSSVFRLPPRGTPFAVLICFEDAFARLARRAVRDGARMLVNQTNDAWFDGSAAAVQHMSQCVFRCVENRVPAVRAANSGVTCFIDWTGRIDDLTLSLIDAGSARFTGYRTGDVRIPGSADGLTAYARYGDWTLARPCLLASAAAIVLVAAGRRRKNRRAAVCGPGGFQHATMRGQSDDGRRQNAT